MGKLLRKTDLHILIVETLILLGTTDMVLLSVEALLAVENHLEYTEEDGESFSSKQNSSSNTCWAAKDS